MCDNQDVPSPQTRHDMQHSLQHVCPQLGAASWAPALHVVWCLHARLERHFQCECQTTKLLAHLSQTVCSSDTVLMHCTNLQTRIHQTWLPGWKFQYMHCGSPLPLPGLAASIGLWCPQLTCLLHSVRLALPGEETG